MSPAVAGRRARWRLAVWLLAGSALAWLGALAALHLLGARACTTVISGGLPADVPAVVAAPLGALYTLAWLGSVAVAPPLLVAAGVLLVLDAALPAPWLAGGS